MSFLTHLLGICSVVSGYVISLNNVSMFSRLQGCKFILITQVSHIGYVKTYYKEMELNC